MNKLTFHKVTWDEQQQLIVIGQAQPQRGPDGLWMVVGSGGAILVLNDNYHSRHAATPEGADSLRETVAFILHPSMRELYAEAYAQAWKELKDCALMSPPQTSALERRYR